MGSDNPFRTHVYLSIFLSCIIQINISEDWKNIMDNFVHYNSLKSKIGTLPHPLHPLDLHTYLIPNTVVIVLCRILVHGQDHVVSSNFIRYSLTLPSVLQTLGPQQRGTELNASTDQHHERWTGAKRYEPKQVRERQEEPGSQAYTIRRKIAVVRWPG